MLCDACHCIFEGRFQSTEPKDGYNLSWRNHHLTAEAFDNAALSNCPICMVVCERLRSGLATLAAKHRKIVELTALLHSAEIEPSNLITSGLNHSSSLPINKCFTRYAFQPKRIGLRGQDGLLIEIFRDGKTPAVIGMSNVLFNLIPQKEVIKIEPPLSVQSLDWPLDLGKRWFQDCVANHQCQKANSSPWVPTRLLELDKPEAGSLRLVCSEHSDRSTEAHSPYMTLSHCWGNIELQTLNRSTFTKLSAGIPVSTLHKTFQDAVRVALFLGVGHIWIDCLCIYQDSPEDWARESSLMGKVYENSVCNISATAAKDGTGGLLQERTVPILEDCYVDSQWEDAPNHKWRVAPSNLPATWLLDGPALYRAWVVQERILAPRVLHFGKRQLYWECQDFDACETYVNGVPKFVSGESNRPNPFKTSGFNIQTSSSQPLVSQQLATKKILRAWREIVNVYAECQLTVADDKLVAISGLAKSVQDSLGGVEYFAGLWKVSILADLSWGTYLRRGKRPTDYRAPSWSWASIDGPILDWGHRGKDREFSAQLEVASLLEISVQPRTSDPTGQIDGGLIRLQSNLMTLGEFNAGDVRDSVPSARINGVQMQRIHRGLIDVDVKGEEIHIIPLKWVNRKKKQLDCLLLQPTGLKKGQFHRYGRLELDCEFYKINSLENIINEPWIEFEEDVGDGRYIISIV